MGLFDLFGEAAASVESAATAVQKTITTTSTSEDGSAAAANELHANLDGVGGAAPPEAHAAAFSDYVEKPSPGNPRISEARDHDMEEWLQTEEGQRAGPNEKAAKRIDLKYDYTYSQHELGEKVGDINTPEGSDKLLSMMTQNGATEDPMAEHRCGPAAILAGVIHAQGTKGIETLLNTMDGYNTDPKAPKDPEIEELRKKLKAGGTEMTLGDMQMVQDRLYNTMKYKMEGADVGETNLHPENAGINTNTMQDFMNNKDIAKMFKDNHMSVNFIDNSGDRRGDHYVLAMMDEANNMKRVYDSQMRENGQLVTQDWNVHDYDLATMHRIRPPD